MRRDARGFPCPAGLAGPGGRESPRAAVRSSSSSSTHLLAADDAQGQRQGEDHARLGIEALGGVEGQVGAAEHALEAAHQVVVADQAEVAAFAETDSDLVTSHASVQTEACGCRGRATCGGSGTIAQCLAIVRGSSTDVGASGSGSHAETEGRTARRRARIIETRNLTGSCTPTDATELSSGSQRSMRIEQTSRSRSVGNSDRSILPQLTTSGRMRRVCSRK